jgi:hypothetical protein
VKQTITLEKPVDSDLTKMMKTEKSFEGFHLIPQIQDIQKLMNKWVNEKQHAEELLKLALEKNKNYKASIKTKDENLQERTELCRKSKKLLKEEKEKVDIYKKYGALKRKELARMRQK